GSVIRMIVAGGLAGLFILLYKSIIGTTPQVRVPNVQGSTLDAAKRQLVGDGLKVGDVKMRASVDVPKGLVISQDPKGGRKVDQGSAVTLFVSSGKPQVAVPDVRGQPETQAESIL